MNFLMCVIGLGALVAGAVALVALMTLTWAGAGVLQRRPPTPSLCTDGAGRVFFCRALLMGGTMWRMR